MMCRKSCTWRKAFLASVASMVIMLPSTVPGFADDKTGDQTSVVIDLPDAPAELLVNREFAAEPALRAVALPEAAPVVLHDSDTATPDITASLPTRPSPQRGALSLPQRGALADRLFAYIPWAREWTPLTTFAEPDSATVVMLPSDSETQPAQDAVIPDAGMPQAVPDPLAPDVAMPEAVPPVDALADVIDPAMSTAMVAQLAEQKPDKKLGVAELEALRAFYERRDFAPLWHTNGDRNEQGTSLLGALRQAEDHALDIASYAAPAPLDTTPEAVAIAEVALARSVIAYARDARGARIQKPIALSPMLDLSPAIPTAETILTTVSTAAVAGEALEAFNPQHAGYKALQARLIEMRSAAIDGSGPPLVPVGKTLRLGQSDDRILAVRNRLNVPSDDDGTLFDQALADAVKTFQTENSIRATGILNQITIAAMNGESSPGAKSTLLTETDLIVNMERWRWMPPVLDDSYVIVNVPEFELKLILNGVISHRTKVVVGKPETQTPIFSDKIETVVVNPTWTVPESIALKEYLPKLQRNPYAMQGRGFDIVYRGAVVDPGTIDWWNGVPKDVAIRQAPGERNALGHIKFLFPNSHAVYLHDTPAKKLFADAYRAGSHGCVRVEDPFALAEVVLGGPEGGWPAARVERLIGGERERKITLQRPMPVHITYFTAALDEQGQIIKFADIYGHDGRVRKALGL